MKKLNLKRKNIIIVACVIVVIVILAIILAFVPGKRESQEDKLRNRLEELGKDFYENYYYELFSGYDAEERAESLKKYETLGIKVNLDNLSRTVSKDSESLLAEFVNEETKEHCNKTTSQAIIYPKDPYERTSYTIEVELECGFEQE